METKSVEHAAALATYRANKKELEPIIRTILGPHRKAPAHPREMRRKLAKQIGSISVSRMISESR